MLFKVNVWSFIIIMVVLAQTAAVGILLADKYENSCHCDYECYCSEISDNCNCSQEVPPAPAAALHGEDGDIYDLGNAYPAQFASRLDKEYRYEWAIVSTSPETYHAYPYKQEDGSDKMYNNWYYEIKYEKGEFVFNKKEMPAA